MSWNRSHFDLDFLVSLKAIDQTYYIGSNVGSGSAGRSSDCCDGSLVVRIDDELLSSASFVLVI
jgi:hypothetical protein